MTLWRKTHSQYHLMQDFFHQQLSSPGGESHKWSKSVLKVDASEKDSGAVTRNPEYIEDVEICISQCQVNLVVLKLHHIMSWFPCAFIRYIAYMRINWQIASLKTNMKTCVPEWDSQKVIIKNDKRHQTGRINWLFNRVFSYIWLHKWSFKSSQKASQNII